MKRLVPFIVVLSLVACSSGGTKVQGDVRGETLDEVTDSGGDVEGEETKGYEPIEQGWPKPQVDNPRRFAIGVFHYNIQYVAGGLKGFAEGDKFDLDNDQVEDLIVKEGLEPLLDILLEHPRFAVDIEMQGYMLDVIRERFPKVLQKLRRLVQLGQVEVMSFHYSDQLFVAHPAWSMQKSILLNKRAFEAAGIPVAKSVFTQEGQFSQGMLVLMKEQGQSIGVLKNNLYKYVLGEEPDKLLYTLEGQDVVVTSSLKVGGMEVKWWAVDDGEVLMAGEKNPYLGKDYKSTPRDREKVVQRFQELVDQGYFLTLVTDYVRRIKEAGVKPQPLEFMLDGTWHPQRSDNLFAWMGRKGMFFKDEADNLVMTSLEASRIELMALERLIALAKEQGKATEAMEERFWELVKDQVLGEVSDATGWNPWRGEVQYGLEHSRKALEGAKEEMSRILELLGMGKVMVDLKTGYVTDKLPAIPIQEEPVDPQWEVEVRATGFDKEVKWFKVEDGVYRCDVHLTRRKPTASQARVTFRLETGTLRYSPAMLEDRLTDIPLEKIATDPFTVGLANGLIGIGDKVFLVEDTRRVHLAAFVSRKEGQVYFEDQTLSTQDSVMWSFYILKEKSGEEAVDFADGLNVHPQVVVP